VKTPAFQLYTGDWKKDPELGLCSPATRGIWIDLICSMHDNDRCGMVEGTPRELARLSRCDTDEMVEAITELERSKAAEVSRSGNTVTVINRRMFDEYQERKASQLRQQKHRDRSRYAKGNGDVTPAVTVESPVNNAVSSSSSSEQSLTRVKGATPQAWSTGRLSALWVELIKKTPTGNYQVLVEAVDRIARSAEARSVTVETHAIRLLQSFASLVDGWRKAKRPTSQLSVEAFLKHFAACEEIIDGERNPNDVPTVEHRREEQPQREYEDLEEAVRRNAPVIP
jgi:hypothetical protein